MNVIAARLVLLLCAGLLSACSGNPQSKAQPAHPGAVTGSPPTIVTARGDLNSYPYHLWIGGSVNRVTQEVEGRRVQLKFIRWSDSPEGGQDAWFHATNPGDRPVLVWNVRQEVRAPGPTATVNAWETRHSDYPGRGWGDALIPAGESVQFPIPSPSAGDWRLGLLYSREMPESHPPNRRFDGTYEALGPIVREPDE